MASGGRGRAESREQRAESREHRAESRDPADRSVSRAESRDPADRSVCLGRFGQASRFTHSWKRQQELLDIRVGIQLHLFTEAVAGFLNAFPRHIEHRRQFFG